MHCSRRGGPPKILRAFDYCAAAMGCDAIPTNGKANVLLKASHAFLSESGGKPSCDEKQE